MPSLSPSTGLDLQMRQQMRITPQMKQNLEILQMPLQELQARVMQEIQTNPVIECLESAPPTESHGTLEELAPPPVAEEDTEDYFHHDGGSGEYVPDDEERRQSFLEKKSSRPQTLGEHLLDQLHAQHLDPGLALLAEDVIASLDDRGYLTTPAAEIAQWNGASTEDVALALRIVQTLDPPGVGARDLAECLLLQLQAEGLGDVLAADILRDHSALLERRDIPGLAKALRCSEADIRFALQDLAALVPYPGRAFSPPDENVILTEATIVLREGRYVVRELQDGFPPEFLVRGFAPQFDINPEFQDMAKDPDTDKEFQKTLKGQIARAEQLRAAIEFRRQTTLQIAWAIVERQQEYFAKGNSDAALRPMTQKDIAQDLGISDSTVSRTVSRKWMKTPGGNVRFDAFFSQGIASGDASSAVSNKAVKLRVREIIDAEDKSRPLSDQAIATQLASEGITLSREAVKKYRNEFHIPSSTQRKLS